MSLPSSHLPYTDVYFLRSLEILQKLNLNPFVRAQIFFRSGPGKISGMREVLEIIQKYSQLLENQGQIFYLPDEEQYQPEETVLCLEGKIQDLITLETMILGVLSAETTKANDRHGVNLENVTQRVQEIVKLVGNRPIFYFGARHWRYDEDANISQAAFLGGAAGASTQIGAETVGKSGVGTIPHSLETIFAWKYGIEKAVAKSTEAFDHIIDKKIPRIALVDYANTEITDTLAVAKILGNKLTGVRIDTCGENIMEGEPSHDTRKYWSGRGVTISGIAHLKKSLINAGYPDLKLFLSSGFGEVAKVKAFVAAETELQIKLFDSLGIGNIFDSRISTMDIVGVGETLTTLQPIAKVGRRYKPNHRLIKFSGAGF